MPFRPVFHKRNSFALDGKAGEVIRTVADLKELQAKGLLFEAQVIVYSEQIEKFGIPIPIVETTDRSSRSVSQQPRRPVDRIGSG